MQLWKKGQIISDEIANVRSNQFCSKIIFRQLKNFKTNTAATWIFTKTISALEQELEIQLVVYIDNIHLLAETKEKLKDQASDLSHFVQCLGFTINSIKTILEPSKFLEWDHPDTLDIRMVLGFNLAVSWLLCMRPPCLHFIVNQECNNSSKVL